jgi:sugar lactone lactonase YvrE
MARPRRIVGLSVLGLFALLLAYLLAWPVPIDPEAWHPPAAPRLAGPFERNDVLAGAKRIALDLPGPESVAVDADGTLYTGLLDGRIVSLRADGSDVRTIATTGGRPLGVKLDASGTIYVADANKGLLRVAPGGAVEVLAAAVNGQPLRLTDDLSIARDGTIYFSDASQRPISQLEMDILEHRPHGRLLAYRPQTKTVEVVADGLYWANGVCLAADESYALVAETSSYRVMRVWLTGDKRGHLEVFVDNLPGFPDNVTWSPERKAFWIAIGSPRDANLDKLAPHPFVRKVVARLPKALQPKAKVHSFALAFDEQAHVVANLQDEGPKAYGPIASVVEANGTIYLGSYLANGLAWVAAPRP